MDRRTFLRATGGVAAVGTLPGRATADEGEENPTPADGTTAYRPKVRTIRYPLAGVPAIRVAGDELRVELDPSATGDPAAAVDPSTELDPSPLRAALRPSFGDVETATGLDLRAVEEGATSAVWNAAEGESDEVVAATFRIPGFAPQDGFTPDLYDLEVAWDGGSDRQPRAVSVREAIPGELDVAVIADPQIADPRAMQTGGQESTNDGSPEPFVDHTTKMTGEGPDDRWQATRRAIAEVNATDPDLVLFAGDLTFGQDAPGKYYAEYEDAWTVFNELRAPSFCTIGNHDGYVQGGVDGRALYRETFGPPSYAVDVGDGLRVVAVDTYDWSYLDRTGGSFAVSTYGGQVRDPQFAWLREATAGWRSTNADGTLLAFGHHNPSWQPDPENRAREETDDRPVAEQIGRGSRYPESGQLWTGENQFAVRELFDEADVTAFFSGHSHRDRIARTVNRDANPDGVADVAETHGPRSPGAAYHYVEYDLRDGANDDGDGAYAEEYEWTVDPSDRNLSDDDLVSHLRDTAEGTLYVNCTTSMSSTGQYWGWRPLSVDTANSGLDPATFGYPATREFLDERAVSPGQWNPGHAEVGLYSHPSYLLSVETVEETDGRVVVRVRNDLATDVAGALVLSIADCAGARASGGSIEWRRRGAGRQDAKIAFDVAAGSETTVALECVSNEGN